MKVTKCFLTIYTFCFLIEEHQSRLCPEENIDKIRRPRKMNPFQADDYHSECYPQDTVRYEPATSNEIVVKKSEKAEIEKTEDRVDVREGFLSLLSNLPKLISGRGKISELSDRDLQIKRLIDNAFLKEWETGDKQRQDNRRKEGEEEEFEFVEPMVFDLVRGLGAKPGESEANYLMVIPLNGDHIAFSPEYEIVYGYHQGIEVELPIVNAELEFFKVAHQTTFIDERDHKTGFQVFGEVGLHQPLFGLDAVYIDATRIGPNSSNMLMIGIQTETDTAVLHETFRHGGKIPEGHESLDPRVLSGGIIINNSVFTRLGSTLVVGLEILSFFDVTDTQTFLVFYPQIHVSITATLTVQLGLGFFFDRHGFIPQFAYRVINESAEFE